jgi:hypothetical protein
MSQVHYARAPSASFQVVVGVLLTPWHYAFVDPGILHQKISAESHQSLFAFLEAEEQKIASSITMGENCKDQENVPQCHAMDLDLAVPDSCPTRKRKSRGQSIATKAKAFHHEEQKTQNDPTDKNCQDIPANPVTNDNYDPTWRCKMCQYDNTKPFALVCEVAN